ncbi:hypothetical protein BJ508DRAFT_410904 [Ascobolus immersus RN42]|uniref:Uncharacterized protein n=1 Tax=Ascobolus immersus RN42 TaxID=1160509 RepID=A0A3N4IR40_ASCIM|nr:hypothetical protein BJ508DRAFT_410904 [Ascobolus immersus RN42]
MSGLTAEYLENDSQSNLHNDMKSTSAVRNIASSKRLDDVMTMSSEHSQRAPAFDSASSHTVYRTFILRDDSAVRVTKRLVSDNKISILLVPCQAREASCEGACLLSDPSYPGENVENCPIPGCSSPDYPT